MTDVDPTPPPRNRLHRWFGLSGLQRKALLIALVLSVAGVIGYGSSWFQDRNTKEIVATEKSTAAAAVTPAGSSFITPSGERRAASNETPDVQEVKSDKTWAQAAAPWATRLGFGFLGGFAVGFATRTYLKTMAIIAAIATAALAMASYFNVFDIDLSRVENVYRTNQEWVGTQADKLKDLLMAKLPSTGAGFIGAFVGFLRKS